MCYLCILKFLKARGNQGMCPFKCDSEGKSEHMYLRPNMYVQEILRNGSIACGECGDIFTSAKSVIEHK